MNSAIISVLKVSTLEPWQAVLLAIIEGLTEYLPISSTGHMIVASAFMGIQNQALTKDYTIIVQFGAILSVLVLYWRRFLSTKKVYFLLIVGFVPAAILGFTVKNSIDILLGNVAVVGWALFIGGILLLFTERLFPSSKVNKKCIEELSYIDALWIGFFQCLAFVPGVSRAAATIWGGLQRRCSWQLAMEFSFLLAVPTLIGATAIKVIKIWPNLDSEVINLVILGNLISFIVGALAIQGFVEAIQRFGMKPFGYYRILLGGFILVATFFGIELALL